MEQPELHSYLIEAMQSLRLDYFITGSIASSYYGEPRFTNDIDVVVRLSEQTVIDFCRRFPSPDFYVSEEAAIRAVRSRGQFGRRSCRT